MFQDGVQIGVDGACPELVRHHVKLARVGAWVRQGGQASFVRENLPGSSGCCCQLRTGKLARFVRLLLPVSYGKACRLRRRAGRLGWVGRWCCASADGRGTGQVV